MFDNKIYNIILVIGIFIFIFLLNYLVNLKNIKYAKTPSPLHMSGRNIIEQFIKNNNMSIFIYPTNLFPEFDSFDLEKESFMVNSRDLKSESMYTYFHIMDIIATGKVVNKKYLAFYNFGNLFSFLFSIVSFAFFVFFALIGTKIFLIVGILIFVLNYLYIIFDYSWQQKKYLYLEREFQLSIKDEKFLLALQTMLNIKERLVWLKPILFISYILEPLLPLNQKRPGKEKSDE
jgi:hypothetical protein